MEREPSKCRVQSEPGDRPEDEGEREGEGEAPEKGRFQRPVSDWLPHDPALVARNDPS
jgi:hypothetical protein